MLPPRLGLVAALMVSLVRAAAPAPSAAAPKAPVVSDPEKRKYELPVPPDENVAYGPHRMQVIYFWRARSDRPTPLLFYIHGGGWNGGDLRRSNDCSDVADSRLRRLHAA